MREIKFSAYDATSKSIIEDYAHIGQYGELVIVTFHSSAYGKTCPNLTLLQYTGIKDKNGNEIYEGDIVEYIDNPTNMSSGTFEVIFHNGFIGIESDTRINLYDIESYWIKIIGNKFENPELLERK